MSTTKTENHKSQIESNQQLQKRKNIIEVLQVKVNWFRFTFNGKTSIYYPKSIVLLTLRTLSIIVQENNKNKTVCEGSRKGGRERWRDTQVDDDV